MTASANATRLFNLAHIHFAPPVAARADARAQLIAGGRPLPPTPSAAPKGIARWVLERAGIDPTSYRYEPLLRRVPACLRALKAPHEAAAIAAIDRQSDLLAVALDTLLIGVTEFFRDAYVFEALRTQVLPPLMRRGRPLRIWSASCSSGEELYSVAMLLAEEGHLESCELLGTDCRAEAIEEARAGVYCRDRVEAIEDDLRRRYFHEFDGRCRVIEHLRSATTWKVADLTAAVEPGPWDLILWRNTAIYMTADAGQRLWGQLAAALAPGGILVGGKAERPPRDLKLTPVGRCIFGSGRSHLAVLCPLLEASA